MQKTAKEVESTSHQKSSEALARILDSWLSILHVVGKSIFGPLWLTLFESIQDAIALGLLVRIPSLLSQWVLGREFSGLDVCWSNNTAWSVARYACIAVVLSDYTLWAVLIPRIIFRFCRDFKNLFRGQN